MGVQDLYFERSTGKIFVELFDHLAAEDENINA